MSLVRSRRTRGLVMFSEGIRLRHSSPRHLSWEATVSCIRLVMDDNVIVEETIVSWSRKSAGDLFWISLDSSASSTAGTTGAVMWYGCHLLDPSDTEAVSCEHSYGCLGAWTGCPCAVSARSSD